MDAASLVSRGRGVWTRRGLIASASAWAAVHRRTALAQSPVMRMGRIDSLSPIRDIEERVLDDAFARIGVRAEYVQLPFLRLIEMANEGEIDGDTGRIADAARRYPNLIQVPTPICNLDLAMYGRGPDFAKRTRSEIAVMNIGIVRGIFALAKYTQGMKVTEVRDTEALANMLSHQRVDAAMGVYVDTEAQLQRQLLPGIVRWPYVWASEPLYCLLHKRHAVLAARLDTALLQMSREGRIARHYAEGLRKIGVTPLVPAEAVSR